LADAAAIPENAFTVWANVFDRCALQAGEHFLVHGGASGIGYFAIQLAKARGATVYTTAGGADKAAFCKSMGADFVYDYRSQDWLAEITTATNKRGVDVVLDMVGGDYYAKNIKLLALEGRMASIAFLRGGSAEHLVGLDLRLMMMKRLTLTGSTLRARSDSQKAAIAQAVSEAVMPLIAQSKIKLVIHRVFALADVVAAHELLEANTHMGKVLLEVNADFR
jgi:NADPH:quinone reductase